MHAFLVSCGVIALAEIGDKTQLLALVLAARFKKPVPIILGILIATIANHALAGALGAWIAATVKPEIIQWILGISFLGMAIWTLIPDKIDTQEARIIKKRSIFSVTLITFFLAEIGDKTQLATVAMATHFAAPIAVVAGTTLGMLIADVPAVFLGDRLAAKIPMRLMHMIAAAVFAAIGVVILVAAVTQA